MFDSRNVYSLIAAVQGELAKVGISKGRRNQQQGYTFRGIDDVYNSLSPLLAQVGLVVLPRIVSREVTERSTVKGGVLFSVVVEAEFDFVSAHDGSQHCVRTYGEAMDSGDKATNKAMSAAYKYAALMTFAIPTEGDNDADAVTHDGVLPGLPPLPVLSQTNGKASAETPRGQAEAAGKPEGFDEQWSTLQAVARTGMPALGRAYAQLDPAVRKFLTKGGYAAQWEALRAQAVKRSQAAGEVS